MTEEQKVNDVAGDEQDTGPIDKMQIPFTLKGKKGIRYLLNRINRLQQENDMRTELGDAMLANYSREIKSLMKIIGKLQDELYDSKRKRMYEVAAHENTREELEKLKKSADLESRLAKSYFDQSNKEWDGNFVRGSVFKKTSDQRVKEKYPNAVLRLITVDGVEETIYDIVDRGEEGSELHAISNTFTTPELAWDSAAELMDQGRLPTPRVVEEVKTEMAEAKVKPDCPLPI